MIDANVGRALTESPRDGERSGELVATELPDLVSKAILLSDPRGISGYVARVGEADRAGDNPGRQRDDRRLRGSDPSTQQSFVVAKPE